jgi:broad specificity phosphatase PhoE
VTPPIVFVRHGETDWNAEARLQGHRDIPLNEKGRSQARRNGEAIAKQFAEIESFDYVASPLGRTRETMEIVRATLGLKPADYRLDDRLKEAFFGDWEGFTIGELSRSHPDKIAERKSDIWEFEPPGGESYRRVSERVGQWVASLERPTLAVAHGGVWRVLRVQLLNVDRFETAASPVPQDNAFFWQDGTETLV